MGILVQNESRNKAIFTIILLMSGSLFVSRALLSVSMILFVLLATVHPQVMQQFRRFRRSVFLVSITGLFFIPFISGWWSEDLDEWSEVLVVKLPFLLLPFAFAGQWRLRQEQWRWIALSFILFTILACCQSLLQYFSQMSRIHEGYLRAKTIPTPLGDDHVRFSWLVCVAVMTAVMLVEKTAGKSMRWLIPVIIFLVVYLHVLSARTGLAMVYLFVFCYAIYRLRYNIRISFFIIAALFVILLAGRVCFPTFQNRIRYNLYDLSFVMKNEYRSGTSDGNRVASLKAGWALLREHPVAGVGAGDIWRETGVWYDEHVKGIKETDKLFPSNEWLVHGCMAGWPGIILFSCIIFLPFFIKNISYRFFWVMFHLLAILTFLVETSLETQYGIFIYIFFSLCWWKWHCFEKNNLQFAV